MIRTITQTRLVTTRRIFCGDRACHTQLMSPTVVPPFKLHKMIRPTPQNMQPLLSSKYTQFELPPDSFISSILSHNNAVLTQNAGKRNYSIVNFVSGSCTLLSNPTQIKYFDFCLIGNSVLALSYQDRQLHITRWDSNTGQKLESLPLGFGEHISTEECGNELRIISQVYRTTETAIHIIEIGEDHNTMKLEKFTVDLGCGVTAASNHTDDSVLAINDRGQILSLKISEEKIQSVVISENKLLGMKSRKTTSTAIAYNRADNSIIIGYRDGMVVNLQNDNDDEQPSVIELSKLSCITDMITHTRISNTILALIAQSPEMPPNQLIAIDVTTNTAQNMFRTLERIRRIVYGHNRFAITTGGSNTPVIANIYTMGG